MAVSYFAEDVKMPAIKKRETTDWIRRVASGYGKKCGDIAYIFCSDEKILEVNKAYLQHDYYTDVITFDYHIVIKIHRILFLHDFYRERTLPRYIEIRNIFNHLSFKASFS